MNERRTLAAVSEVIDKTGRFPTVDEITATGRVTNRGHASNALRKLESRRLVTRTGHGWRTGSLTAPGRLRAAVYLHEPARWLQPPRKQARPTFARPEGMLEGTLHPHRIKFPANGSPLRSGTTNQKLGGWVTKGRWAGARIMTLALEERRTCPASCEQWDRCVVPGTRVLTADLRWVPVESLQIGDRIAGFDEHGEPGRHRRTRVATVEKIGRAVLPCVSVRTDKGGLIVSEDHLWLRKEPRAYNWRPSTHLVPGDKTPFLAVPWTEDRSYEAGRLRGFVEGEGTCGLYDNAGFAKSRISWAQRPSKLCDEMIEVAHGLGFQTARRERVAGVAQSAITHADLIGGWREVLQFLGRIRPTRMIEKAEEIWADHDILGRGSQLATVQQISAAGDREVVTIQTSTRTMVAEGFFTHNCYGDNMSLALRTPHGPDLERRLVEQLGRIHAEVVAVRLHELGDFYSVAYAELWGTLLRRHPWLHVFGYTAWTPRTPIGAAVQTLNREHPERCWIRTSGFGAEMAAYVVKPGDRRPDAFACPEQHNRVANCGACGACWSTRRSVTFEEH